MHKLPVGRGRSAFNNRPAFLGPFIDGWELVAILTLQSGFPYSPTVSGIIGSNTGRDPRPNRIGDGNLPADQRTRLLFWDGTAFASPPDYTFGNAGRNILRGPGLATWDSSIRKDFALGFWRDEARIEFRAEMFNALNRTNFGVPVTDISSPGVGQIFSTSTRQREVQLALRIYW